MSWAPRLAGNTAQSRANTGIVRRALRRLALAVIGYSLNDVYYHPVITIPKPLTIAWRSWPRSQGLLACAAALDLGRDYVPPKPHGSLFDTLDAARRR
jgi:hypothetical protein